ncbi:MAG: hypothetical protein A2486_01275 [Burkholderiales bacterium RIFOXYC12_FULL_65_23]|uniref:hypothetical protein n=1 Tax=Malikia spinosa TaxID=86180 RepID=UPI0008C03248|nr:MAG: hypothetical protein A2486_01275 [Burkholderiales bacterium RIFOXYC12_FULL_65_23]
MALPDSRIVLQLPLALLLAGPAGAQSLSQSASVGQTFDVVQFGVPRDARFVFCDGADCPQRSIKHLQLPPAPTPKLDESVQPVPQLIQPAEALSPVNVTPRHKPLKRKPRKPGVRYECKPVTRGK